MVDLINDYEAELVDIYIQVRNYLDRVGAETLTVDIRQSNLDGLFVNGYVLLQKDNAEALNDPDYTSELAPHAERGPAEMIFANLNPIEVRYMKYGSWHNETGLAKRCEVGSSYALNGKFLSRSGFENFFENERKRQELLAHKEKLKANLDAIKDEYAKAMRQVDQEMKLIK